MENIGLVIADENEFAPVKAFAEQNGGTTGITSGDRWARFSIGDRQVYALLCGIGKVNAAHGTAVLCYVNRVQAVVNFGLSGALQGLRKNDIALGTGFVEHDFDLTALGYPAGHKPGQTLTYAPDARLYDAVLAACPQAKPCVFACGDLFVGDSGKKAQLIEQFHAGCCDMETAAVAAVCAKAGVPFVSFRSISDDADDCAAQTYTHTNARKEDTLLQIFIKMIQNL